MGAGLTYWLAWTPTQIAFDQSLADAAWALIPQLRLTTNHFEIELSHQAEQVLRVDHFDSIYFVVRDNAGKTITGDKDFPSLLVPGAFNEPLAYDGTMRGEPIRIIALKTMVGANEVLIGAAETLKKRRDIRWEIIRALLFMELALVILSVAVVRFAVTRGLFPLLKMRDDLNAINHNDLSPVAQQHLPVELLPLVNAINDLLSRIHISAKSQQDFLANVAHQLRTPLAGIKTQLEWIQHRYANEADTARSAGLMMSSIERMVRQTNQLLALARAEPSRFEKKHFEVIRLDKLVEESIHQFVREADQKEIDLGFDLHSTKVMGDRFLLRDLIDNLVDNAIRYSPRCGTVTVSCTQQDKTGVLSIEDSGPGIPLSEQEKIFSRFYRLNDNTTGSGLGLAIVRDIAEDHEAEIILRPGTGGKGTIFTVKFSVPSNAPI